MKNSSLKFELSKTEVMLVGGGKYFEEFAVTVKSPLPEISHLHLVNSICSLGVLLDFLLMLRPYKQQQL